MTISADQADRDLARASGLSGWEAAECWLTGPELRSRFQQKYEYTRVLQELSLRQQELIAEENYSQLIDLLLQKQRVIAALQEVSTTSPSLRVQWRATRDQLPSGLRQDCERWLDEAEELLRQILETEQHCTSSMQVRRDVTQSQLASVSGSLQIHRAYDDGLDASRFDYNS